MIARQTSIQRDGTYCSDKFLFLPGVVVVVVPVRQRVLSRYSRPAHLDLILVHLPDHAHQLFLKPRFPERIINNVIYTTAVNTNCQSTC